MRCYIILRAPENRVIYNNPTQFLTQYAKVKLLTTKFAYSKFNKNAYISQMVLTIGTKLRLLSQFKGLYINVMVSDLRTARNCL